MIMTAFALPHDAPCGYSLMMSISFTRAARRAGR